MGPRSSQFFLINLIGESIEQGLSHLCRCLSSRQPVPVPACLIHLAEMGLSSTQHCGLPLSFRFSRVALYQCLPVQPLTVNVCCILCCALLAAQGRRGRTGVDGLAFSAPLAHQPLHFFTLPRMQMITHLLGGEVKPAVHGGEYGRMPIDIKAGSTLFSYLTASSVNVWMSHGDEAVRLPEGFSTVAISRQVCFDSHI